MALGVASGASEAHEGGSGESTAAYRPHLDGLRAVAVYLVVLFHAGVARFSGGYIGVDVFFVLSGFLVTQLLLRDIHGRGSIRFRRFYSRRFRRLLPAAFVALLVTAAVYAAIASPAEVSGAVSSFKAAFLYSTNWYFIHQSTSYFGADVTNPVLHFWSLAVEEQFYLVWPLALGGLFALTRRMDSTGRMRVARSVVLLGALASAVWALSLRSSDPNRAYYGTDTRAYELLAGAFIALVPSLVDTAKRFRRLLRTATVLSGAALLVLASSWVDFDAIERGVAVTVITCVGIVAIEVADGGFVKRALSSRSMVYLGKVSYGTYLWHWIVILVLLRVFAPSEIATAAIAVLIATALASLSFEMLERPVRMSGLLDRAPRAVIASGLVISVVAALVLIPRIAQPADASKSAGRNAAAPLLTPVPAGLDSRGAKNVFPKCLAQPGIGCTIVNGSGRHLLLMGDSNAAMLIPMFAVIARREDLTLSVATGAGCPWQRDLFTRFELTSCRLHKDDLYRRIIPALHPDIIVVMNLAYGSPGPLIPALLDAHRKQVDFAAEAQATRRSVALLRAGGRDVVLMEPIPVPIAPSTSFNPFTCLYNAKDLEQCRYRADPSPSPIEKLYRQLAQHDDKIHALDLDTAVCPLLPVCDPMIDGVIVKIGPTHLTTMFAEVLAPEVDTDLKSIGLLPR